MAEDGPGRLRRGGRLAETDSDGDDPEVRPAREAGAFARRLADASPYGLLIHDLEPPRGVFSNVALAHLLGVAFEPRADHAPRLFQELPHPDDRARLEEHRRAVMRLRDGHPAEVEARLRSEQSWRWVRLRSTVFARTPAGSPARALTVVEDIAAEKATENAIAQVNAELARSVAALEAHGARVSLLSEMGEYLHACTTMADALPVIDHYVRRLMPGRRGVVSTINDARDRLEPGSSWGDTETWEAYAPDECWAMRRGRLHVTSDPLRPLRCAHLHGPAAVSVCVPMLAQGEILGSITVRSDLAEDVTDVDAFADVVRLTAEAMAVALTNLRLRSKLREQAIKDPLTGLFNRRYMEESLRRELAHAERRDVELALIIADLDHFKHFNDAFGHAAGDAVLEGVAHALAASVRESDLVCRFGGEEFVLVLADCGLAAAVAKAEELRAEIASLRLVRDTTPLEPVTISFGVASARDCDWSLTTLLRVADDALYEAKARGRDCVVVGDRRTSPRFSMATAARVSRLPPALANGDAKPAPKS